MKTEIQLGRVKLEAFSGSGGLLSVVLHSAKGAQQIDLTPGEWQSLELLAASVSIAERRADADKKEIDRLTAERDVLRKECDEWHDIAILQHETLESVGKWPPKLIKCGWCVRAAGDDQQAADKVERFDLDGIRAHSLVCSANPLVTQLKQLEAALAEKRAQQAAFTEASR